MPIWSNRRNLNHCRSLKSVLWNSALIPNITEMPKEKQNAANADRVEGAVEMSRTAIGNDRKKHQEWSTPRKRGRSMAR